MHLFDCKAFILSNLLMNRCLDFNSKRDSPSRAEAGGEARPADQEAGQAGPGRR